MNSGRRAPFLDCSLCRLGKAAHDELAAQLRCERPWPGALLEAASVPGGRVIGDTVDTLAGPKTGPDRRDVRAETTGDEPEVQPTATDRRRRRSGTE
ncbi:MAG: hypothetical protein ACYS9X_07625 [Planctomycetota bacterium]